MFYLNQSDLLSGKADMQRFYPILIIILAGVIWACAGGNSAPKRPPHLSDGMTVLTKGIARYDKGCYQQALEYFFRAHELFCAADQLSGVAMSLNNIGNVYRIVADTESAILFFDKSLNIYEDIGDQQGVVQVLSNKAAALIDGGQLEAAADVLKTAEDIAQKNSISYGPLLSNRGILFIKKKDYQQAKKILETALAKADPANVSEFATANFAYGTFMLATESYEKAVEFFETALSADRSAGFYNGIAGDLAAIGSAYLNSGCSERALEFFERSIKIYALIGNGAKVKTILEKLETISKTSGQDLRVTLHFVNQWIEGKAMEDLCK